MNATSTAAHLARTTWWPSPWGAGDALGMLNHIDDAKRVEALRLVRTGRMYDLGHVLDEHVPGLPRAARFHQTLVTTAHHANMGGVGSNRVNWITEVFSGTTQLGTHLDALSHLQIGGRGYDGLTRRRDRDADRREQARDRDRAADRHARLARRRLRARARAGWRDRDRRRRAASTPAPATRSSSTPAGARAGTTPTTTSRASPARASSWPSGSPTAASRSPAATRGATARCRRRIPSGRSRCRST